MSHRRARTLSLTSLAAAAVLGLTLAGSPPAQAGGNHGGGSKDPVATGLNNPRQLSFTRSGDLLVAEAGTGGTQACDEGPEGGTVCFGTSGSVTKVTKRGKQSRIITGLPSIAGEGTGAQAIGPSDVAAEGGAVTVLIGLGADPAKRADLPEAGSRLGTLIQTTRFPGRYRTVADLAAWEATNNPINDPDSNPVGLLVERGHYLVADAGGNTVLRVGERGRIRQVASFADTLVEAPPFIELPPGVTQIPMQAVPTSVATRGGDGAYYVSQLTGFPFPPGAASIYRIDPRTGAKTVYATGLTNVTDLAFRGSTLYAVQIAADGILSVPDGKLPEGSVVKIARKGSAPEQVGERLPAPYGIAIKGDTAYVTTGAVLRGGGQVVKVRL